MDGLQQQLTELMLTPGLSEQEGHLAVDILRLLPDAENDCVFSEELVDSISNFLIKCDKISPEARASLEERLDHEMKKEREAILSLYPRPRKDNTGRWRARPYGRGNRKELVKNTLKEWDDAIIEYHKSQLIKDMTLRVAVKKYNDDRDDITDNTKVRNVYDMTRFAGCLMDRPISSITALEIQRQYVSAIKSTNASIRSCNNYKGILRRVFKHSAKHYGCVTININDCIDDLNTEVNKAIIRKPERPLLFEYPKDRFTKEEAISLEKEVFSRDTLCAYACLVPLYTGQRIGEVAGMFKDDIDLDNHIIHIRHTAKINKATNEYFIGEPKKEKKRIIVFPDVAVPLFRRIMELSDAGSIYLFSEPDPKKRCDWIDIRRIDYQYRTICTKLGFREVKSAHDMRRTYDSILDEVAMSSALRHLLLGHELTGIDANYLRDSHSLKEVQDTINSAFELFLSSETKDEYPS